MRIVVNGAARESEATDLAALVAAEADETGIETAQGVAIALNGTVVRRRDWGRTPLETDDRVEIVRAMQGG